MCLANRSRIQWARLLTTLGAMGMQNKSRFWYENTVNCVGDPYPTKYFKRKIKKIKTSHKQRRRFFYLTISLSLLMAKRVPRSENWMAFLTGTLPLRIYERHIWSKSPFSYTLPLTMKSNWELVCAWHRISLTLRNVEHTHLQLSHVKLKRRFCEACVRTCWQIRSHFITSCVHTSRAFPFNNAREHLKNSI